MNERKTTTAVSAAAKPSNKVSYRWNKINDGDSSGRTHTMVVCIVLTILHLWTWVFFSKKHKTPSLCIYFPVILIFKWNWRHWLDKLQLFDISQLHSKFKFTMNLLWKFCLYLWIIRRQKNQTDSKEHTHFSSNTKFNCRYNHFSQKIGFTKKKTTTTTVTSFYLIFDENHWKVCNIEGGAKDFIWYCTSDLQHSVENKNDINVYHFGNCNSNHLHHWNSRLSKWALVNCTNVSRTIQTTTLDYEINQKG